MPENKKIKIEEPELMFLDKVIDINMSLNDLVDERANILAGIGGIIAVLSLGQSFSSSGLSQIGFFVITLTCLITILLSIGVIRPKQLKLRRKNLMYYGGICCYDKDEYGKHLKEAISSKENIFHEYSKEIHDLSEEIRVRFKMIRRIGDLLVGGLIAGFIIVIISFFI